MHLREQQQQQSSINVEDDDDAGFVYLNQTEVDEGVSLGQLEHIVKTYVSNVYESDGEDLYNVLLYQYRHVQRDWTSSRTSGDSAALRSLLMQLLADGHQVQCSLIIVIIVIIIIIIRAARCNNGCDNVLLLFLSFFLQREISAVSRPIAAKLCHMIENWCNFKN